MDSWFQRAKLISHSLHFLKIRLSKVNGIHITLPPKKKKTYFLCKQYKSEDGADEGTGFYF